MSVSRRSLIQGTAIALGCGLAPLPGLRKAWETFRPQGRLNFGAAVYHPTGQSYDLEVRVDAQGGAVEPTFFPLLLHDIGGQFHYHLIQLTQAEPDAALFTVPADYKKILVKRGAGNGVEVETAPTPTTASR